ncbi:MULTISPECIES: ATP synthase subunit I [Roseobacteraceae]|uniref:F0F1 ATP synthase subunit A-like protein n=1 Tax=Celeribacter baekdonensis B30 TaxID=1208323 RepID=K2JQ57_9RHOB|nr:MULTISPECIES: ATP synthase subunit I [Roseobacteraceae]EKE72589.1 F0F1 ATP synthase subunit A-like protein [Celeribacter baekdonensis B30]|tara:strand:+ start:2546 stop:2860 length:315 start_codon:yes stop_codon:yes gene_type:complete
MISIDAVSVDWMALLIGLASGAVMSAVFFAGLAYGMRRALKATRPVPVLILSAVLRMVLLLGAGWVVVTLAGVWAFAGFALAFVILRFLAIRLDLFTPGSGATS